MYESLYHNTCMRVRVIEYMYTGDGRYEVATIKEIDKIIGLFCKRALYKRRYSAKETYDFIDPTDRSHPIMSILCPPTAIFSIEGI